MESHDLLHFERTQQMKEDEDKEEKREKNIEDFGGAHVR